MSGSNYVSVKMLIMSKFWCFHSGSEFELILSRVILSLAAVMTWCMFGAKPLQTWTTNTDLLSMGTLETKFT